ncbi:MAG: S8 family serine peptidase [Leptospiraceae bacterium]|nr:S8 family serine peptidase [Leptospiraceae bacterium]
MKTKILQIFIIIFHILFTFHCGSLYLAVSGEGEEGKNNLLSLLVPMALKGGESIEEESNSQSSGGDVTISTPIEPTNLAVKTEISPTTQVYVDAIKAGKYELDSYSYVSLYFKTNTEDSAMQIEENDKIFLKMKEIQFTSTSGEQFKVETGINYINLLMGKKGKVTLINKASIPQGTYSKAIIVLDEPNGFVEQENGQSNINLSSNNEITINFSNPVEFVNGLTTEINVDFYVKSINKESDETFSMELSSEYISSKMELPFRPGYVLATLTSSVTITKDKDGISKTGLDSLDKLLFKHRCALIKRVTDEFTDMDMEVAREVGLDKAYVFVFEFTQDVVEAMLELNNDSNIESITTNDIMEISASINGDELTPTDIEASHDIPGYWGKQANYLDALGVYKAWYWFYNNNNGKIGNQDIKIAVVDSGVDSWYDSPNVYKGHPELKGKVIQGPSFIEIEDTLNLCPPMKLPIYGSSPFNVPCFIRGENSIPYADTPKNYHGTFVSGIIVGQHDNGGIAGFNWESKVIAIKVTDIKGEAGLYAVGLGILEAVKQGANIINLSIGGYNGSKGCATKEQVPSEAPRPHNCVISSKNYQFQHKIVQYAHKKGVVMVAAAGNEGLKLGNKLTLGYYPFGYYPASFPEVISVSSATLDVKERWRLSNYGQVDIAAIGDAVYSTVLNGGYYKDFGTSYAAPMVSALASLILSIQPDMHPKLVLDTMCATATMPSGTTEEDFGCGIINIGKVFTNAATDPSQDFPKISVHPNYTSTCETDSGSPIICYRTRHSFLDGERGRENTISFYDQPLMVSGGESPYTWSIHNMVNQDGMKPIDFMLGNLCFLPLHTYAFSSTFEILGPLGNGKKIIEHLDEELKLTSNKPKKSSALLVTSFLDDPVLSRFNCFRDESFWTVEVKVTDMKGRSNIKTFDFFKDYEQYHQYKLELERQSSPLPYPLFPLR